MQLRFVGCGDAFGSGGRFNTCFHVTGDTVNFLIDCGASSLPALKRCGTDLGAIDLVLITHFHGDHFAGLPFLILDAQFGRRERPLTVAGPAGLPARLTAVMEALFEHSSATRQRFDLDLIELVPDQPRNLGAIRVTPCTAVHGQSGGPFLSYRIEVEGRTIAYTGDTEWTDALVDVGRGADLFIAEAYTFGREVRNHLGYDRLAAELPRIGARHVVLTHLGETMLSHADEVPYTVASDGLVVDL